MQLRKNVKVEMMKRVPLFAQCSKRELEEIAAIADELDLREGKELTREGAAGREFFILLDGEADVRKGSRKIATMRSGDFFGEIALVSSRPRTATVVAKTPVRVLVVTERSFKKLLEDSSSIQRKVLSALADRVDGDNL